MTLSLDDNTYLRSAKSAHETFEKARKRVAETKQVRGVIFQTANEEGGLSYRKIGDYVGLSHSAVQQAIDAVKSNS